MHACFMWPVLWGVAKEWETPIMSITQGIDFVQVPTVRCPEIRDVHLWGKLLCSAPHGQLQ